MSPLVHIVVLNWNGCEDTLACLASLRELAYDPFRVVVVDNGSRESPRARIEADYPGVDVVENEINLGYAGGNNVGIRHALDQGAEFVWVLNNDTVVDRGALAALVATAERRPEAAAVGSKVCFLDRPETVWVAWGRVTWLQSLIGLVGQGAVDGPQFSGERAVPWIPGCSLLFRARALHEVGIFDERYFAYHEDVEWAARARRRGWQLWYAGDSRVLHSVHGSSGGESHYGGFRKYLSARNSVLYAREYGTPVQRAMMAAAIAVTLPFQWLRRRATGEQEGIALKLRGWRDGLAGRPIPFVELGLREKSAETP